MEPQENDDTHRLVTGVESTVNPGLTAVDTVVTKHGGLALKLADWVQSGHTDTFYLHGLGKLLRIAIMSSPQGCREDQMRVGMCVAQSKPWMNIS